MIQRRRQRRRVIKRRPDPEQNTKFTRRKRAVIYRALESRLPITRAVELAGLSFTQYREWMNRGLDRDEPLYRQFRKRVKEIQAGHERDALEIIRKAARGGHKILETKVSVSPKGNEISRKQIERAPIWQAAAWFLERRFKEDYGREPYDPLARKTPSEVASEIKRAADSMFNSVPNEPDEEEDD